MEYYSFRASFLSFLFALLLTPVLFAQDKNPKPKLNQLGFYPEQRKIAVTPEYSATSFHIREAETGIVVYQGTLSSSLNYSLSAESVKIADFSDFAKQGSFELFIDGGSSSFEFEITNRVFDSLSSGLIKALYYNRASVPLLAEHAGPWARAAGHPDDAVIIHPSAESPGRPAGSTISSPGGWYDAGDFNKYVVPISSSISHMLTAYEQFPDHYSSRDLNIPESGDAVPDILDEALFALRWLLTMQDPYDGGVYNKLTHAGFQGTVMPAAATASRYVVQKGTTATLDFAAVMAQSARVYEPFLPDFADSALAAARNAWNWAEAHPNLAYNQDAMNSNHDPDISTGAYGDSNFDDEWFWAGSELYISTSEDSFFTTAKAFRPRIDPNSPSSSRGWANFGNSGWGDVYTLGLISLAHNRQKLTASGLADTSSIKSALINAFDWYVNDGNSSGYRSPFGIADWQFNWGSNGTAGNLGMGILMAYSITGNQKYYNGALDVLDYLMGRNAVGYSYVTGFGDQPPMHIHHRQSEADNVVEPTPGWVAGGANPNNRSQDCGTGSYGPNSNLPALGYGDLYCSYSTNEVTTYWNSPFIYLTAGLEHYTADVPDNSSYPVLYTVLDNPDTLLIPGEEFTLKWAQDASSGTIDIHYKRFSEENFSEVATNVNVNDGEYPGFIVPYLPGDSLIFRFRDSADPEFVSYSSVLKVKPSPAVTSVQPASTTNFQAGRRISISWNVVQIDTIDFLYKLASEEDFTLYEENIPSSEGEVRFFKIPDAPGDSLIFRVRDAGVDSIYLDSAPVMIEFSTSIDDEETPQAISLHQNYPNPFNPNTVISYNLPVSSSVSLKVFDMTGREVATLVNERKAAGLHTVRFEASELSSGVYIYKLETGGFQAIRKMLLIK